jgi:hypothetical protein
MGWRYKSRTPFSASLALALAIAALVAPAATNAAGEESYVVVVSPDVPVSDLRLDEVRRLFGFRQQFWSSSLPVTVLYSDEGLAPGSFMLDRIYGLEHRSLKRLILEKLYSGEIDLAPKVVSTDTAVVDFVGAGQGLIGLVRADAVAGDSVKILTIEGKAPDAGDYPLRR